MTLRRPPTAFTLKASDVSDLQNLLAARSAPASDTAPASGNTQEHAQCAGKDAQVERERREREEREARGTRGRVMGEGGRAGAV